MQSAVEKQFLDLERKYWQALQDGRDVSGAPPVRSDS